MIFLLQKSWKVNNVTILPHLTVFFLLFHPLKSGLGSGSVSGSRSFVVFVFKTLDLDPDPQEMDADPKPLFFKKVPVGFFWSYDSTLLP